MKTAWLVLAVVASVFAGAGGGLAASHFLKEEPAAKTAQTEVAALDGEQAKATDHSDELAKLQQDINSLMLRIEKAEAANSGNAALQKKYDELSAKVADMKKSDVVVAKPEGEAGVETPVSDSDPVLAEKVEKILAEREAAERAARDAEREKQMADMVARRNTQILDKLTTELSLTEAQKTNVQVVLDNYTKQRREVFERGNQARTDGVEFDWGAEFKTVNDAAAEAVRGELSTAQVSTFNTLLGEGSLDDLAGGWGGMGRGNRGGRGGGGQGGGGNGR